MDSSLEEPKHNGDNPPDPTGYRKEVNKEECQYAHCGCVGTVGYSTNAGLSLETHNVLSDTHVDEVAECDEHIQMATWSMGVSG